MMKHLTCSFFFYYFSKSFLSKEKNALEHQCNIILQRIYKKKNRKTKSICLRKNTGITKSSLFTLSNFHLFNVLVL